MPTKKQKRRKSKAAARSVGHKTFRIRPYLLDHLQGIAKRTGWSEAEVVNRFLHATYESLEGKRGSIAALEASITQATQLAIEERKREAILAPLRQKAREARLALRPLVQRIKEVRTPPKVEAA